MKNSPKGFRFPLALFWTHIQETIFHVVSTPNSPKNLEHDFLKVLDITFLLQSFNVEKIEESFTFFTS